MEPPSEPFHVRPAASAPVCDTNADDADDVGDAAPSKPKHGGRRDNMSIWTAEEDALLLELYARNGPDWKRISREITEALHVGKDDVVRNIPMTRNRYMRIEKGRRMVSDNQPRNSRNMFNRCTKCGMPKIGHTCPIGNNGEPLVAPPVEAIAVEAIAVEAAPVEAAPVAAPRLACRLGGMFNALAPQGAAPTLDAPPRLAPLPAAAGALQTAAQRLAEVEDAHQRLIGAMAAILDRGSADEAESMQQYVPLLVTYLAAGPLVRRAKAADLLSRLPFHDDVISAGGIAPLVALLSHGRASEASQASARALARMSAHSPERSNLIVGAGAVLALWRIAHRGDAADVFECALTNLAAYSAPGRQEIESLQCIVDL